MLLDNSSLFTQAGGTLPKIGDNRIPKPLDSCAALRTVCSKAGPHAGFNDKLSLRVINELANYLTLDIDVRKKTVRLVSGI